MGGESPDKRIPVDIGVPSFTLVGAVLLAAGLVVCGALLLRRI
jgi:hypothetical protein